MVKSAPLSFEAFAKTQHKCVRLERLLMAQAGLAKC